MKRSVEFFVLFFALVALAFRGHLNLVAAAANAQVTIEKRVSVPSRNHTQRTAPLAGAQYRLVKVAARSAAKIDPAKPNTYQELTSQVLTTQADGTAVAAGLPYGIYVLQEQKNAEVSTPAAPVVFYLNAREPQVTYAPKSGLESGNGSTNAGGVNADASIMQTNGSLPAFPWLQVAGLASALLLTMIILAFGLRKKVTPHASNHTHEDSQETL